MSSTTAAANTDTSVTVITKPAKEDTVMSFMNDHAYLMSMMTTDSLLPSSMTFGGMFEGDSGLNADELTGTSCSSKHVYFCLNRRLRYDEARIKLTSRKSTPETTKGREIVAISIARRGKIFHPSWSPSKHHIIGRFWIARFRAFTLFPTLESRPL